MIVPIDSCLLELELPRGEANPNTELAHCAQRDPLLVLFMQEPAEFPTEPNLS